MIDVEHAIELEFAKRKAEILTASDNLEGKNKKDYETDVKHKIREFVKREKKFTNVSKELTIHLLIIGFFSMSFIY